MVFGFIKLHRQVCHVTSILWSLFLTIFFFKSLPIFPSMVTVFFCVYILAHVATVVLMFRSQREGPWVSIICIAVKQMHCQQKKKKKKPQPAWTREEDVWGRQCILLLSLPSSLPLFSTCLPASIGAGLGERRGRGGGVFAFLFREGKGIDISRNRPLHVDISLLLLGGRLSVGWIKLSRPIPPLVL